MCTIYSTFFFLFSLSKASIVQYLDLPYEKRLNLTPTSFPRLVNATAGLLEYYYNVEQDCAMGKPIIPLLMITVSEDHNLHAVVTSYRGKGKIHLGTRAYCDILHPCCVLPRNRRDVWSSRKCLGKHENLKKTEKNFPLILSILIVAAANR